MEAGKTHSPGFFSPGFLASVSIFGATESQAVIFESESKCARMDAFLARKKSRDGSQEARRMEAGRTHSPGFFSPGFLASVSIFGATESQAVIFESESKRARMDAFLARKRK